MFRLGSSHNRGYASVERNTLLSLEKKFFHFSRIFHWHAKASWDELSESTDPEDRVVDSDHQAMVVDVD